MNSAWPTSRRGSAARGRGRTRQGHLWTAPFRWTLAAHTVDTKALDPMRLRTSRSTATRGVPRVSSLARGLVPAAGRSRSARAGPRRRVARRRTRRPFVPTPGSALPRQRSSGSARRDDRAVSQRALRSWELDARPRFWRLASGWAAGAPPRADNYVRAGGWSPAGLITPQLWASIAILKYQMIPRGVMIIDEKSA